MAIHNPTAYDAIIVLGARLCPDDTPSEALRRRMRVALAHYQEGPAPVICCGAQGADEPRAEGDFMREWFVARGVPDGQAISESLSRDTIENIRNAKAIMADHGWTRALVVTSDYHIRRALAVCRRYGMEARGAGSPSVRRYWLKNHARECLAWGKYCLWLLGLTATHRPPSWR